MMRYVLAALFLAALAGCGSDRPAPERQSFLLQAERAAPPRAAQAGSVRVGRVSVASPFGERAFIYRRDDVRYETDFFNQFAADPADMVAEATTAWLRQGGLFRQVQPTEGTAPADYRLEASISALYVDFQGNEPAAVLNVRWQMVRERDGATVLDLGTRQRAPLKERSPAGAARAYREALEQALGGLENALAGAGLSSAPPIGRGGIPG